MIDTPLVGPAQKPALKLSRSKSMPTKKASVGTNSGKRSLSDVLDEDLAVKRMKVECKGVGAGASKRPRDSTSSRMPDRRASTSSSVSDFVPNPRYVLHDQGSSKHTLPTHAKENISPCGHLACEPDEVPNPVNQEEGYISPAPSYFRSATPDLSSPVRHPHEESRGVYTTGDDFGADIVSSPVAMLRKKGAPGFLDTASAKVLVRSTPSPVGPDEIYGPDLRDFLSIATPTSPAKSYERSATSTPSTTGLVTPEDSIANVSTFIDEVMADEDFGVETQLCGSPAEIVANGWWNKWALKQAPSTVMVSQIPSRNALSINSAL